MNVLQSPRVNDAVRERFVGRTEPLDSFYQRFAYRHMKNGVYYCGTGGLGKSWILQKIILNGEEDPTQDITEIIDFFDTQNHSVRGLQFNIRKRLGNPKAFDAYDKMITLLEAEKAKGEKTHPSSIASLELETNQIFIDCCKTATIGREVILLFDTFEKVQQLHVGQWLSQAFLAEVRNNLIVAIAGRPIPDPANMPDNIELYELSGFNLEETQKFIESRWPEATEDIIESINDKTNGVPLVINLILDLPLPERNEYVNSLNGLETGKRLQETPDLQRELVGQFAHPPNRTNRVIWAMSYLRRRFDVPMLKYVVENTPWFPPGDYRDVLEELTKLIYIKDYPTLQSHLLHDEIQRMVYTFILEEANDSNWQEMRVPLYELIVENYYPDVLIPQAKQELKRQLEVEQIGYILDHEPKLGLELYKAKRQAIESTYDYDFEELLWGEIRGHIHRFADGGYELCIERGRWLRKHSLFTKGEEHYREMAKMFKKDRIGTHQALGFMLLRQGKLTRAKSVFLDSLNMVSSDDFSNIAMIENNLGQTARAAGQWDDALKHYTQSFRAAALAKDQSKMVSVYINRGHLYSLQGLYDNAKQQCQQALKQLETLPSENPENIQRSIYAWMNLGTAYRYSGGYAAAAEPYQRSLQLAQKNQNHEAIANVLQLLGVNEHQMGRQLRRQQKDLTHACNHQLQAWQYLTQSLEMAREANSRNAIASGLNRLAKVYREIFRLQNVLAQGEQESTVLSAIQRLEEKANTFKMPFEIKYRHVLLTKGDFSQLSWLGKSSRMFEVSDLVANEVSNFHLSLESLTEVARTLEELGYEDKVPIVLRRIDRIKGYDYQGPLFASISKIILGSLDFKQGKYEIALEKYVDAYTELAKQSGYANYIFTDRLRDLEWRLRELPSEMALKWCDTLEDSWLKNSLTSTKPAMVDLLENTRLEILERQGY